MKKIKIDTLNSPKNNKNFSYINRLNKSKEFLPEGRIKIDDANFTDIQSIQLSGFELSKPNSKGSSSRMKQSLNDYCRTSNEYNQNLSKSNIINQKKGGIIFNSQKKFNNLNCNKSEKQNSYDSSNNVNRKINNFPKSKYSNSGRLTKFFIDNNNNSISFNYKVLNKDNSNAIKRPINFNDDKINHIIENKTSQSHKKKFPMANKNIDNFLEDHNTLNRLNQNEGIQLSSQKNQNIKINKNKIIYICNVNCDNYKKIKDNKNY